MSLVSAMILATVLAAGPADSPSAAITLADSTGAVAGPRSAPVALTMVSARRLDQDTVPRRRARAVTYSDGYAKRVAVHKALSWAMLPLFAASYVSGNQLLDKGSDAPDWAETVHPIAATGSAVLFGANAVTGTWNLWEGRKDPNGRTRRVLHSVLFLAASGGFAYAGSIADDAEENGAIRERHRNVAIASMSASTASWLIMLIGN